jgi:hypothetical protein
MQKMLSKYNQDTFWTARHFRELQKHYIVKKKHLQKVYSKAIKFEIDNFMNLLMQYFLIYIFYVLNQKSIRNFLVILKIKYRYFF